MINITNEDNMDLRLGDCIDIMKTIPNKSIDAIITDPPYGTTACKWDSIIDFKLMWEQLNRIIKPSGAIVLFGSEPFSSALRMSNIKDYKYDWVWIKNFTSNFLNAKKQPLRRCENILVFYKKQSIFKPQLMPKKKQSIRWNNINKKGKNGSTYGKVLENHLRYEFRSIPVDMKYPDNVLEINQKHRTLNVHPTQKPITLMEYLIKTYTNENETVLDFTMGSGSTGIACHNLKRKFIGIELNKEYFEVAIKRLKEHQSQLTFF